jgi:hypothetical protein
VLVIDFLLSAGRVTYELTILNGLLVSFSETVVINAINKAEKHMYFHHLNERKLWVIFYSAISERLQLYSQSQNFTISYCTLNAIFSNANAGVMVCFSAALVDW